EHAVSANEQPESRG
nr:immunoglobulin heavy chain junction region [Homo sapiens]